MGTAGIGQLIWTPAEAVATVVDTAHDHRRNNKGAPMYIPKAYRAPEPRAVVRDHPFATLVSSRDGDMFATATPIYFETDDTAETRLIGHLAGNNPHAAAIADGDRVLAIFAGPHAYVSASWYVDYRTVPTWDYVTAQVRGTIHPVDDEQERLRILHHTIRLAEAWNPEPWRLEQVPAATVDQLLPHIRAFRIRADDIAAATKLSQTHPPADRRRIVAGLRARNGPGDQDIAALVERLDGTTG